VLTADPTRLDQILGNLLVNALRHTPAGGKIKLCAAPIPDGVRLAVRDTGEGIAAKDLPYVFDRFWRGDKARTHSDGTGGGLGLAIVKQLVGLHNGRIIVTSEQGQGATFTIELPVIGEP
jgi:two-component system sensor histidine kinase BaeS